MRMFTKFAAVTAAAGALTAAPTTASATEFQPEYYSGRCDYGRACLYSASNPSLVWNADRCFDNFIEGNFYAVRTHGNPATVILANGTSVYVPPNSTRSLSVNTRVVKLNVHC